MDNTKLILKNLKKAKAVERLIEKENDINQKINLLDLLANIYYSHGTGIYFSYFLEKQLVEISELIKFDDINDINVEKSTVLHIMTAAYPIGGHTRVVKNWIQFDKSRKHSVLINEPEIDNIPIWLKDSVINSGGEVIINIYNNTIEKANYLRKISAKFEKIILHINNDDIIPTIAFGNSSWQKHIYLYNHSDHIFWVGACVADTILDMTSEGMKNSIQKRGYRNNKILPIPIEKNNNEIRNMDKTKIKENLKLPIDSKIVLSMAEEYKYNNVNNYNFDDFAIKLINLQKNIYFLIIGANKKHRKWEKLYEKSGGKVRAEGNIAKDDVAKYMQIADIYVDSFPMNSYTCLLEGVNNGVPVVSLKTPIPDLDALASIKISSIDEILKYITNILTDKMSLYNFDMDNIKAHNESEWIGRLNGIFNAEDIKHSVKLIKVSKNNIDEYDKFIYEVRCKFESFSFRKINKLSLRNRIKLIHIYNYKIISSIYKKSKTKYFG